MKNISEQSREELVESINLPRHNGEMIVYVNEAYNTLKTQLTEGEEVKEVARTADGAPVYAIVQK